MNEMGIDIEACPKYPGHCPLFKPLRFKLLERTLSSFKYISVFVNKFPGLKRFSNLDIHE